MKYLPIIFFLFIYTFSSAQNSNEKIDKIIEEYRTEHQFPAIAASVITLDECHYGIGGTTIHQGDKNVTLDSKFHLGSNTKALVSIMAMRLIEEKKISLETPFFSLFPELKKAAKRKYRNITLAQLLSHRSGLRPFTDDSEDREFDKEISTSERRKEFAKYALQLKPVEKGSYSNAGLVLATLMLENVSGKSFEGLLADFFKENNWDYFVGFPNVESDKNPTGHSIDEKGEFTIYLKDDDYHLKDYFAPAGDVSMNIVDYSKFIQMHLKGLNGDAKYVSEEAYQKMHFYQEGFGLGWGNGKTQSGSIYSAHDGSAGTFYTHTLIFPERKMALVVMTNSITDNEDQVVAIYELRRKLSKLFKSDNSTANTK